MKLSDLIAKFQYVENRNGKFFTECPFHRDFYESVRLHNKKKSFMCSECGSEGSAVDFVMKLNNLSKKEASLEIKKIKRADDNVMFTVDQVINRLERNNETIQGILVSLTNEAAKNHEYMSFLKRIALRERRILKTL